MLKFIIFIIAIFLLTTKETLASTVEDMFSMYQDLAESSEDIENFTQSFIRRVDDLLQAPTPTQNSEQDPSTPACSLSQSPTTESILHTQAHFSPETQNPATEDHSPSQSPPTEELLHEQTRSLPKKRAARNSPPIPKTKKHSIDKNVHTKSADLLTPQPPVITEPLHISDSTIKSCTLEIIHSTEGIYTNMLHATQFGSFNAELEYIKTRLQKLYPTLNFDKVSHWSDLPFIQMTNPGLCYVCRLLEETSSHIGVYSALAHHKKANLCPSIDAIFQMYYRTHNQTSLFFAIIQSLWRAKVTEQIRVPSLFSTASFLTWLLTTPPLQNPQRKYLERLQSLRFSLFNLLTNNLHSNMDSDIKYLLAWHDKNANAIFAHITEPITCKSRVEKQLLLSPFVQEKGFRPLNFPSYKECPELLRGHLQYPHPTSHQTKAMLDDTKSKSEKTSRTYLQKCHLISQTGSSLQKHIAFQHYAALLQCLIEKGYKTIIQTTCSEIFELNPNLKHLRENSLWTTLEQQSSMPQTAESASFLTLLGRALVQTKKLSLSKSLADLLPTLLEQTSEKDFINCGLRILTRLRYVFLRDANTQDKDEISEILEHMCLDPYLQEYSETPYPLRDLYTNFPCSSKTDDDFFSLFQHIFKAAEKNSSPSNSQEEASMLETFRNTFFTNLPRFYSNLLNNIQKKAQLHYCLKHQNEALRNPCFDQLIRACLMIEGHISYTDLYVFLIDFCGFHNSTTEKMHPKLYINMNLFLIESTLPLFFEIHSYFITLLNKKELPYGCELSLCRTSLDPYLLCDQWL